MNILEEMEMDNFYQKGVIWFKRLIAVVCVLVVLLFGIGFFYQKRQEEHKKQDQIVSTLLLQCLRGESVDFNSPYIRPANDLLRMRKIKKMLSENNFSACMLELENLISSSTITFTTAAAKVLWMSIALDQKNFNKDLFLSYGKSFASSDIFFARSRVLMALFFISEGKLAEARAYLEEVTKASDTAIEEVKAVLQMI